MKMRENLLKKKIKNGESAIGTFVKMTDPCVPELLALAGLDFFVLDTEHVAIDREQLTNIVRAAEAFGITPIVRVRENNQVEILQNLDTTRLSLYADNLRKGLLDLSAVWLSIYRRYVTDRRALELAGKNKRGATVQFTGKDLCYEELYFESENELQVQEEAQRKQYLEALKLGLFSDEQGQLSPLAKAKALRNDNEKMQRVYGGSVCAPINMKNEWGDFFFYSQHLVQIMTEVFGHDVKSIIGVSRDDAATFIARYADYDVTGHFGSYAYAATIYAKSEVHHVDLSLAKAYVNEFRRFEHMVRTGGMPESYEELINPVFILNAIKEALDTGKEVEVKKPVI